MPVGPRPALALLILPAALAGCGLDSRERHALDEVQAAMALEDAAAREAALARLRGAEPLVASTWLASAAAAPDPRQALQHVEAGLAFQPAHPDLQLARLSLLAQAGRPADQARAAQALLSAGFPPAVRAEIHWFLIDALLAQGQAARADEAAGRLGGLPGVPPAMVAAALARVALAHELSGAPDAADRSLQASLDLGPDGLTILRREGLASAERGAAGSRLVQRAAQRLPDDPDLALFLVVDRMATGELDAAQAAFAAIARPLPERLGGQEIALRARLLVLQDRVAEGLDVLRARLDEQPSDAFALGVLLETWHQRRQPPADELARRLKAGWARLGEPLLRAQVEATLRELEAAAGAEG